MLQQVKASIHTAEQTLHDIPTKMIPGGIFLDDLRRFIEERGLENLADTSGTDGVKIGIDAAQRKICSLFSAAAVAAPTARRLRKRFR